SFWSTENDLKIYVNNLYRIFPAYKARGNGQYQADYESDNMAEETPNTRLAGQKSVPTSASSAHYNNGWYNNFDVAYDFSWVRNVNIFIDNYQRVDSPWEQTRQYVGEAYFFRAYLYFDLLKYYGDLPWINKPLTPDDEDLFSSRISRSII